MNYYRISRYSEILVNSVRLLLLTILLVSSYTIFLIASSTIETESYGLDVSIGGGRGIVVLAWINVTNNGFLPVKASFSMTVENKALNFTGYGSTTVVVEPGESRILSVNLSLPNNSLLTYLSWASTTMYKFRINFYGPLSIMEASLEASKGETGGNSLRCRSYASHGVLDRLDNMEILFYNLFFPVALLINLASFKAGLKELTTIIVGLLRNRVFRHVLYTILYVAAGWIALYALHQAPEWVLQALELLGLPCGNLKVGVSLFSIFLAMLSLIGGFTVDRVSRYCVNVLGCILRLYIILYALGFGKPLCFGVVSARIDMIVPVRLMFNLRLFAVAFTILYIASIVIETIKLRIA